MFDQVVCREWLHLVLLLSEHLEELSLDPVIDDIVVHLLDGDYYLRRIGRQALSYHVFDCLLNVQGRFITRISRLHELVGDISVLD
jgi:uncharacterized membrane protein